MFGSGVLDTVIGVVFVFLLVSLLVTTGNELLAALMRSRAKWLEYGVDRLIGSTWARRLYEHPLIEGSTRGLKKPTPGKRPWFGNGPSYIPSRTFANILMEMLHGADNALRQTETALRSAFELASAGAASVADIRRAVDSLAASLPAVLPANIAVAIRSDLAQLSAILGRNHAGRLAAWLEELEGHTRAITEPALAAVKSELAGVVADARDGTLDIARIRQRTTEAIAHLPSGAAGDMVRANLSMVLARLDAGYSVGDAVADVQRFIRTIPAGYVRHLIEDLDNEKVSKALLTLFDDAGNNIETFKENIEVWFNNAMDRVGGWYKRRSQRVTAIVSLLVVVAMNVDALLIVRYLDAHPGVRDGLVTQVKAVVDARAKESASTPAPAARTGVVAGDSYTGRLSIKAAPPKEVEVVFSTDAPGATFRPPSVLIAPGATSVGYTLDTAISDEAMKATVSAKAAPPATAEELQIDPATVAIQPSYVEQLRRVQDQLMGLKLPIGWARHPTQADSEMRLAMPTAENFWNTVSFHLLGWLITAIAATLGAPFWFDMLNKIMSIRSAGKAPEEMPKSPEVVQAPMGPGQSAKDANQAAARTRAGAG